MKRKVLVTVIILLLATGAIFLYRDGLPYFAYSKWVGLSGKTATVEVPDWIRETAKQGIVQHGTIGARVKRVVDGDTLVAVYKGKEYRVRLLDIDTPESVKQGVPVQCYAKEAFRFTRDAAEGKTVKLVFEKDLYDPYDRLLAYIILEDGKFLNALLVRNGYARVVIYSPNVELRSFFTGLQREAILDETGFWGLPAGKQPFIKDFDGDYIPSYKQ